MISKDSGLCCFSGPEGLSLDLVNRVMYWTDRGSDLIGRSSMDGQDQSVVVNLKNDSIGTIEPRGIIAEPINGFVKFRFYLIVSNTDREYHHSRMPL